MRTRTPAAVRHGEVRKHRHAAAMQSGHAFICSAGKTFGSHCASNHPDSAQKISTVDCHMKSSVRFFVSMPISNASPAR
jgi:hypothetical protein